MSSNFDRINNLNSIGEFELNKKLPNEHGKAEDELRVFTDTNFYDFDMGRSTDIATTVDELLMQQEKEIQQPQKRQRHDDSIIGQSSDPTPVSENPFDLDQLQAFSLAGDIPGYSYFGNEQQESTPAALHTMQRHNMYQQMQPFQPLDHRYPVNGQVPHAVEDQIQYDSNDQSAASTPGPEEPKSKPTTVLAARKQAEEDKRRRNTAASARFRIKKKLKEQEMERSTKQMQNRIEELETKVRQLEMENKWLKNLAIERNEKQGVSSLEEMRSRILGKAE